MGGLLLGLQVSRALRRRIPTFRSFEFGRALCSLSSPRVRAHQRFGRSHTTCATRLPSGTHCTTQQRSAYASSTRAQNLSASTRKATAHKKDDVSRAAPAISSSAPRPQRPGRQHQPHGHHALHEGLAGVPGLAGEAAGQCSVQELPRRWRNAIDARR